MNKILTSLATGVLTLATATIAWAAPTFYLNPVYNMSNLQAVKVIAVENNSVAKTDDYQICTHAEELVMGGLYEAAGKANLIIADGRVNEPAPANRGPKMPITVELQVNIGQMGVYQDLVPGYWTERNKEEEVEVWDKEKRRWVKQTILRKEKVWVPERWRDNSEVSLVYSIVDPTTGVVIAKSVDNRKRTDESDVHGMVKRSTRDFLKNLTKKR